MVSEERAIPTYEELSPQESLAPEVDAVVPIVSFEVNTPITTATEPEVPNDLFPEPTQPPSFPVPLQKVILDQDCSVSFFISFLLDFS